MPKTDFAKLQLEASTLKNLQYLKLIKDEVVDQLGKQYDEAVVPYINIISMVMKANAINEFEALKLIKETLSIYNQKNAPELFAAALIEIVEAKYFEGFEK